MLPTNAASCQESSTPEATTSRLPALRSGAAWLASETPEVTEAFLEGLSDPTLAALPYLFEFWALEHQLPPEGAWRSWVVLGGRGAGKTRAGAEWVRAQVEGARASDPGKARRIALVGETLDQVREVMIFGESGIMACTPPDRMPEWQAGRRQLVWPNGAIAQVFSAYDPESLRGPQFDAAWVDEIGCAAVDKGTNEPNKFVDLISSESALPLYSSGRRDDLIQHAYYTATLDHWTAPENNPVSSVYGAPMVDTTRIHAWTWDARPFPFFPNTTSLWSDSVNYARGHWLNGRVTAQALADVVAEICERAGLRDYDVSDLYGLVRGFTVPDVQSARSALQPLMLVHGFEVVEKDGTLVFRTRRNELPRAIDTETLALDPELEGRVQRTRVPDAELSGRVQLHYVEEGGDYANRAAEALLPGDDTQAVSQSSFPLSLTYSEAQATAERWLAEARVARESIRFALPMSNRAVDAGDVIALGDSLNGEAVYRVDRIEEGKFRMLDAVRVSGTVYQASDAVEALPSVKPFQPVLPVFPLFLDAPLLSDDVPDHTPRLAGAARPWPGSVAVYSAFEDAGYSLDQLIGSSASIGVTKTVLRRAAPGIWDRGEGLRVAFTKGTPSSISEAALLRGGNVAAIGNGSPQGWEIFQFREATLVAPDVFDLSFRLRGQLGSDADMPEVWPIGSYVVLLTPDVRPLSVALDTLSVPRFYRIGPAQRPNDDPSYVLETPVFRGIGLRPYAPAHLRCTKVEDGYRITFLRRTRSGGDSWDLDEVPLGEAREAYRLRVVGAEQEVLRIEELSSPEWIYTATQWSADGSPPAFQIEVAQVSERFGPGAWKRISVDA